MKVVHMCSAHPKFDKRVHHKINLSLMKEHEVISVHPNENKEILNSKITIDGFKVGKGKPARIIGLVNLYKKTYEYKPDLIICPEPDSLFAGIIYKLLNRKVKVVFDCHEWYELRDGNGFFKKTIGKFVGFVINRLVKLVDGVIVVNDTMNHRYKNYNQNTITLINTLRKSEAHRNSDIDKLESVFIYSGNFVDKYQEKILFEAAIKLKELKSLANIIILGGYDNNEDYSRKKAMFDNKIMQNNLRDHIKILPWMPRLEANEIVSKAMGGITRFDSYLYGDLHCLPNKVFDYISQGLMIVSCIKNKEITQIIDEFDCGVYTKNESAGELATLLHEITKDAKTINNKIENAKNAFEIKYNWDNYEKNLLNYIKLL